jgi:hypothetical protein
MLRKWKEVQDRTSKKLSSHSSSYKSPTQADKKQPREYVPTKSEAGPASTTAKRMTVQNETLRRERTQVHHYELQLRREILKLTDLEDALVALESETGPKDSAQRDQDRSDLQSLIGSARFRVEMRERELNAAKGLLLRRLLSTLGTS